MMIEELQKLRELTDTLTGNGYLKDQAEEWEYALDAIPDYVYVTNTKSELKFVNKILAERLNKSKAELYNKFCYKVIDSEDADGPPERLKSEYTLSGETEVVDNVYLRNLNGWFAITRSPIYTKTSKLLGFICVLQDITEKRKALRELLVRDATLETIFNAAPIGIGLMKRERVILSINRHLVEMVGYSQEELIGQSIEMLYANREMFDRVGRLYETEVKEFGVGATEAKMRTKDGRIIDVYIRTSLVNSTNNIVFTVTDITNRKRRESKLKENEQKYRLIAENLQDSVWTLDTEMNFTFVTPVLKDLMGYAPDEWIGHNVAEFTDPEDLDGMIVEVVNALTDPGFNGVTFKSKMIHKDGRRIPIEINAKPIRVDGELVGFQGVTKVLD